MSLVASFCKGVNKHRFGKRFYAMPMVQKKNVRRSGGPIQWLPLRKPAMHHSTPGTTDRKASHILPNPPDATRPNCPRLRQRLPATVHAAKSLLDVRIKRVRTCSCSSRSPRRPGPEKYTGTTSPRVPPAHHLAPHAPAHPAAPTAGRWPHAPPGSRRLSGTTSHASAAWPPAGP